MKISGTAQMAIGFALFLVANASAQGLIPDTTVGKWIVLISTTTSLYMQRLGIKTEPDRPPRLDPPQS